MATAESYLILAHTWPHMENIHVGMLKYTNKVVFFCQLWTFSVQISVAIAPH